MTASNSLHRDRLYELLADEASDSLDTSDAAELARLLEQAPFVARDELLQAAALAQVAFLRRTSGYRMPAGLKVRLVSQGEALVMRQRVPVAGPRLVKTESPATPTRKP